MSTKQHYLISMQRKLPNGQPDVMGSTVQHGVYATSFKDALARASTGDRFIVVGVQGPGGQWWHPHTGKPPPYLGFGAFFVGFGAPRGSRRPGPVRAARARLVPGRVYTLAYSTAYPSSYYLYDADDFRVSTPSERYIIAGSAQATGQAVVAPNGLPVDVVTHAGKQLIVFADRSVSMPDGSRIPPPSRSSRSGS